MKKEQIKIILSDIRFWIILLFLIRLIGIMNAPLETGHNWRQALTNMIARNFLENGANIFFPKIDMAGEKTGIIGSEFPFFNYLIYFFSHIFSYTHWHGRLINLIVSSTGIYFFFKLVKSLFDKQIAFHSTIILSVSIWFAFSRKIMPDTFSVSLVIIGLYYAYYYLQKGSKYSLVLFFVFCTLGILCKIPALSLFAVLSVVPFIKEIDFRRKIVLYSVGVLCFCIVCLWYFYWVPHLLETYRFQLYFPKGISEGIQEIIPLMPELLEKFYFSSLQSYVAFTCFVVGAVLLFKSKNSYFITGVSVITTVFVVFIIKTGAVFPLHNYYIIPFTPVMALLAGYTVSKTAVKYRYIVLAGIVVEGILNQQHDFRIKDSKRYKLELEKITEKHIPKKELIIINGGSSPQDIYFSNRKGWTVENPEIANPVVIDSLTGLGAKYLIVDMNRIDKFSPQHTSIYQDEHYSIYRLIKEGNTNHTE